MRLCEKTIEPDREGNRQSWRAALDLEKGYGSMNAQPGLQNDHVDLSSGPSLKEDWQGLIDDDALLSSLTIPGTHDSAAFTHPWPFVATQSMNISQQLHAGIRYFDLRCGIRNDVAEMVHGPSLLGLQLQDVLDSMFKYLGSHPTEGLIVQIKEDREPEKSTVHFSQVIWQNISSKPDRWRTANTTPTMGELRGKIQLFRRYQGPRLFAFGIDVTQWQDNPELPFTIFTTHDVQITIQDHYSFSDPKPLPSLIISKGGDVQRLLDRAPQDADDSHWYMNFTSAFEFNLWYQLTPRTIALGGYYGFRWEEGMNVRLRNYLRIHSGKHRFGIVAMDFPETGTDDLITTLIQSNFKYRVRYWPLLLYVALLCIWITMFAIREARRDAAEIRIADYLFGPV
ncbi:1-phosphatidylinositol phosphodiesterase [Pseudocercospora fuligena]|uniref:1-phosphatidylinositol phosphodiesterase n=1 Tax=Pseudocercospora fuligena TaxID=685502 RepID=A0A8H6RUQ2_9PEZI|nr:1-phosphatidylinositol phosphodiesterase [Pseudocercospora fuligena]